MDVTPLITFRSGTWPIALWYLQVVEASISALDMSSTPRTLEVPDTDADRLSAAAGSGRSAAVALKATELELVLQKPVEAARLNVYAAGALLLFIGGVLAKRP